MEFQRIGSGTPWEMEIGYSRAVKAGPFVEVSGTTATSEDGELIGKGDAYAQTKQALKNIEKALDQLDASISDVIRTRIYVTDIEQWKSIGRAHGEIFGEIRPATSMVEVSRLIDPDMLVEIEAEAYVGSDSIPSQAPDR